jgi:hypothetical protein
LQNYPQEAAMSSLIPKLMLALCLAAGGMPAPTQVSSQQNTNQNERTQGQQPAPKPPAGPVTVTPANSQPAAAANPQKKPHKRVITNDDLEGKGAGLYAQIAGIDLSRVNECDRYCYEQVRQASRIAPGPNTQWKRELLSGIEKVKEDGAWQGRLEDLARVKGKYCRLEQEKNEELARRSDPANVTKVELDIDDRYERKFQAEQGELISAYDRAEAVRRYYTGIVVQFMTLQEQRISNANCPPSQFPVGSSYGDDDP